jgi:hypothetical protein
LIPNRIKPIKINDFIYCLNALLYGKYNETELYKFKGLLNDILININRKSYWIYNNPNINNILADIASLLADNKQYKE